MGESQARFYRTTRSVGSDAADYWQKGGEDAPLAIDAQNTINLQRAID